MTYRPVTHESMLELLRSKDPRQVIGRACVVLFERQTASEQRTKSTNTENGVGFSKPDARIGSLTAKQYMQYWTIGDYYLNYWMKNWRGSPKIVKYWKQLDEAAQAKARTKTIASLTRDVMQSEGAKILESIVGG